MSLNQLLKTNLLVTLTMMGLWTLPLFASQIPIKSALNLQVPQKVVLKDFQEVLEFQGIEHGEEILKVLDANHRMIPGEKISGEHSVKWFRLVLDLKEGDGQWIVANELPIDSMQIVDIKNKKTFYCDKQENLSLRLILNAPYCGVYLAPGKNVFMLGAKFDGSLTHLMPYVIRVEDFWYLRNIQLGLILALVAAMVFIIIYDSLILFIERKLFIFFMIVMAVSELVLIGSLLGLGRFISLDLQVYLGRLWPVQLQAILSATSLAIVYFFRHIGYEKPRLDSLIQWGVAVYGVATVLCMFDWEKATAFYLLIAFISIFLLCMRSYLIVNYDKKIGIFYIFGSLPVALSAAFAIIAFFYFPQYYFWSLVTLLGGTLFYLIGLSVIFGTTASYTRINRAKLEQSLELGRSVQSLLLPHLVVQSGEGGEHLFRYIPYEKQMSGDWVNHWIADDGAQNYLIGDVTGKGPQAALAVAMIASIINHHKAMRSNLLTCMEDINKMLYQAFRGEITTTASGVSVAQGGDRATFVNAAGCGWFVWKRQKILHILGRGCLLGHSAHFFVEAKVLGLEPQDTFFSLTDGLCPSLRVMSHLVKGLQIRCRREDGLDQLSQYIIAFSHQFGLEDDQAFFVYRILTIQQQLKMVA
jgi:hypothetical protein